MQPNDRNIVHMDLDSFFVSVECLEHSELKGKPLIIGGHSDRGVVASCSYEARRFGVHSAMPSKMARKLCPQAIWLHGDMEKYSRYSRLVTDIIADKAPVFEKASIDEFYLDVSGMDKFFGCYKWTGELKQLIVKESGLPISFGLSLNKMVSKVATGESKPDGQLQIPFGTEKAFLAPMPIKKIPMLGPKTAEHLNSLGVTDVATLAAMPVKVLQSLYGKNGIVLWERANAIDDTPVTPYTERKSISNETTFETDTIDVKMIQNTIIKMVEGLAWSLRRENWLTGCVTIKIKYANFDTHTRQMSIPYTSMDDILINTAKALFAQLHSRRMLIRLIGVRFSHLVHGSYQISLFDDPVKKIGFYEALDKIRNKYGDDSVGRAV
ncbi:DNA polymerase IV [Cytophagaceae bacterium ABcell3]|nr:DNA polymerase IV [Cytophagaceae bacterium ABcell3]